VSYDIPDEIKYREKIVFGLDFKQLSYAAAFGVLAFLAYLIPLPSQARMVLPGFFLIAGGGFVFLNLEERAWDAYHYYRGVKKAGSINPLAQRLVGVNSIERDTVFLANGDLLAVLKVEPINFSLLEETQHKAVVLSYREFLNHLTTPVQVVVKTSKPDLDDYFNKAQERLKGESAELNALFEDFMVFEQDFLERNNVRVRDFYLVVSHPTRGFLAKATVDKERKLKELGEKTKIIQEKLLACSLASERLENEGLLRFFSSYSSQDADSSEVNDDDQEEGGSPAAPTPKAGKAA